MSAGAIDKLDRDLMLLVQSLVEQLVTTQRVVGGHLNDINLRVMQERKVSDSDNDLVRALVDARSAVVGAVARLRACRLDLVRDIAVVRELLTGEIETT